METKDITERKFGISRVFPEYIHVLLFIAYRGSLAHGTHIAPDGPSGIDDEDIIAGYIGPHTHYLGFGRPEIFEIRTGRYDIVAYELRKLVVLLVKGNPNVISVLFTPPQHKLYLPPTLSSAAWENFVTDNRELFRTQNVFKSFHGYITGQLHKMVSFNQAARAEMKQIEDELRRRHVDLAATVGAAHMPMPRDWVLDKLGLTPDSVLVVDLLHWYRWYADKYTSGYMGEKRRQLVEQHGWDTKNGAHAVRLCRMLVEYLHDGVMFVDRTGIDAQEIIAIKKGEWSLEQVKQDVEKNLDIAKTLDAANPLPPMDAERRGKIEMAMVALLAGVM